MEVLTIKDSETIRDSLYVVYKLIEKGVISDDVLGNGILTKERLNHTYSCVVSEGDIHGREET